MLKSMLAAAITLSLIACEHPGKSENSDNSNIKPELPIETPTLAADKAMDTTFFWKIMDYSFARAKFDNKRREQSILDQLRKLTPAQIQEFEIIFQQLNLKANTYNNLAAQTIIDGGSSDDRFYYFRCWLISLGKHNFEETLKDPDYLTDLDIPTKTQEGAPATLFEELIPLSDKAYSIVTGKQAEDESFPRANAQKKGLFYDSNGETKGKEWDDKDLPKIAPRLHKKFHKKDDPI